MTLKLSRLPNRTPVKLTCSFPPEIHEALKSYAAIYQETYGETEALEDLVPFIVGAFIQNDAEYRKQRKSRSRATKKPTAPRPQTST